MARITIAALSEQINQQQQQINALLNALNAQVQQEPQPKVVKRTTKSVSQPKVERKSTSKKPQPKVVKKNTKSVSAEKPAYTGHEKCFSVRRKDGVWNLFLAEKACAIRAGKSFMTWQVWKEKNKNITFLQLQKRFDKLNATK